MTELEILTSDERLCCVYVTKQKTKEVTYITKEMLTVFIIRLSDELNSLILIELFGLSYVLFKNY